MRIMGIIDSFIKRMGYTKAGAQAPAWLSAMADFEKYNMPDGSIFENQADLYRKLSWVMIAVQIVSQSCAAVKLAVKHRRGEETDDITNHPFELKLNKPNEEQSRFELLEATFSYHALTGNAYWWLNKASQESEPAEIWCLPSHMVKPVPDSKLGLKGYVYETGINKIPLETWEVVHFKRFNPRNMFIGLSPIEALALVATGDLGMQKYNTTLFTESNAQLPGILAFADPIGDPEWEKIKDDIKDKSHKRQLMMLRNAGKGGVEWIQAALSNKDMEFIAGRKMNKQEIFDAFAPGLYAMLSENATEANSRTAKATFAEFCLWPLLQAGAEKITNDVLPSYNEDLVAVFDDVRNADRSQRLQEQQEYTRTHMIDEVRQKYYGEKPLGDERGTMLVGQIAPAPVGMASPDQTAWNQSSGQPIKSLSDDGIQTDQTVEDELKAWEKFAIARLGKKSRPFETLVISLAIKNEIENNLKSAKTIEDIKNIFGRYKDKSRAKIDYAPLLVELRSAVEVLREAV